MIGRRHRRRRGRGRASSLIPLIPRLVKLLWGLLRDRRVPLVERALVVGVIAYVVSPLDLIPDVLGVLGLTDDLFLLAVAFRRLVGRAGADVVASHWSGDPGALERLLGGLEDLGSVLPGPVRGLLRSVGRED